ncbi:MAG: hypothetical protein IKN86_09450 [Bacteroidaceae bacterium]|nr:hypothetical protein [Bacteroidaceae bacterium]
MKKNLIMGVLAAGLLLCGSLNSSAQTSLVGRVYQNPNIMDDVMSTALKEANTKSDSVRKEAIAKKEKELGRKMKAEELAELDKELKDAMEKAKVASKAVKTAITFTFQDETNAVMNMKMSIDEEALKLIGVSWAKRKAMKAALAIAPENQKCTYVREGNMIITSDDKDKDTLMLSDDGTKLYGAMEKGKKLFILTLKK